MYLIHLILNSVQLYEDATVIKPILEMIKSG